MKTFPENIQENNLKIDKDRGFINDFFEKENAGSI